MFIDLLLWPIFVDMEWTKTRNLLFMRKYFFNFEVYVESAKPNFYIKNAEHFLLISWKNYCYLGDASLKEFQLLYNIQMD